MAFTTPVLQRVFIYYMVQYNESVRSGPRIFILYRVSLVRLRGN